MNPSAEKARSATPEWMDSASGALVWVLFAAAGLLLMWFIAVLNDITERGEQRRMQQRTTGSFILADEMIRASGVIAVVAAGLTVNMAAPGRMSPPDFAKLTDTWGLLAWLL